MNFFNLLKHIYLKTSDKYEVDRQLCITLSKWLAYDKDNLQSLSEIIPYIFYIAPTHFYYLLYFNVPRKVRTPFLRKFNKVGFTSSPLLEKLRYVLGWSSVELKKNKSVVDKIIMGNKKYWKKELSVK